MNKTKNIIICLIFFVIILINFSSANSIPKADKPEVELFVMTYCPYGIQSEKGFIPTIRVLEDSVNSNIRFLHYFMHGDEEETETYRQLCIREEQSDKYLEYLECFLEDGDSDRCIMKIGIDKDTMNDCIDSGRGEEYYAEDSALSQEYNVRGSPTLVVNGKMVSSERDSASYLDIICSSFNDNPSVCDTKLSYVPSSPGFGYIPTEDSSSASCGDDEEEDVQDIEIEEKDESYGEVLEGLYHCPQSDGYIGQIPDSNIHDSGSNGAGDSLEIYCRNNVIRLCLSEEPCPWRNSISSNDESTCAGNYENSPMVFSANEEGINIAKIIGTGNQRIENIYCNEKFNRYSPAWSVELSNTNNEEDNQNAEIEEETQEDENNQNQDCNGCEYKDSCLPLGYRLQENNKNVFCDISKELELQKEENRFCQNDFECLSGQCVEGKCFNLQKSLEKTNEKVRSIESKVDESNTALQKIVNFLKELFGFE